MNATTTKAAPAAVKPGAVNMDALKTLLASGSCDDATAAVLRSAIALQSAEPCRFAIIAPASKDDGKGKVKRYPAKLEITPSHTAAESFPKVWGIAPAAVRAILASPEAAAAALEEIERKFPGGFEPGTAV